MLDLSVVMCVRKQGDWVGFVNSMPDGSLGFRAMIDMVDQPSMATGYIKGIENTRSAVTVFTHSDVVNLSTMALWEAAIQEALNPDVGFVGVAGTAQYGPKLHWWANTQKLRGTVFHENQGQQYSSTFGPMGEAEVMDGVLLMAETVKLRTVLKNCWRSKQHDYGWHFYDIQATLMAHRLGLKNKVVLLPILHKSIGAIGPAWEEAARQFQEDNGL